MDLGTGDGRFVLERAAKCPSELVIGFDASPAAMAEASRRAFRARRGNLCFVAADAMSLPAELSELANHVTIHFPWGSLLRAAVEADPSLTRLVAVGGDVRLLVSAATRDRRGARALEHANLAAAYTSAGFEIVELRVATLEDARAVHSAWGKRLLSRPAADREAWLLEARKCSDHLNT